MKNIEEECSMMDCKKKVKSAGAYIWGHLYCTKHAEDMYRKIKENKKKENAEER